MPGQYTMDSKTGRLYSTRDAAGRAVAGEFGLPALNNYNYLWFEVLRLSEPGRFIDVDTGKPIQKDGSVVC